MQPFRVIFNLRTAMSVPQNAIHLDGLIHYLVGDRVESLLKREVLGDDFVYCASALLRAAPVTVRGMRHLVRKTTAPELAIAAGAGRLQGVRLKQIRLTSGADRQWVVRVPEALVPQIHAFGIGDLDALSIILCRLPSIGKNRRLGLGELTSVEMVTWHDANAWRARVFPWQFEGSVALPATPSSPPYFDGTRRARAWAPTSFIESAFF